MVRIHDTVTVGGEVRKITLRSDSKYVLCDVDYQLDSHPHDRKIKQVADNEWEMTVSAEEMDKIIFGFACRD